MSLPTALPSTRVAPVRATFQRLRGMVERDLVTVMARREALRFLMDGRSRQSLMLGLAAAALTCVLIPLHRQFGDISPHEHPPYFLIHSLLIQVLLFTLTSRAVWAGMRQDAATGSWEELLLTGAGVPELLTGKWLGVSLAGALWAVMLAPFLLLAGAFGGASAATMAMVLVSWIATASAGALAGTLLALSERNAALTVTPLIFVFQFWFMFRMLGPRLGSGLGLWWTAMMNWLRDADPLALIPAATGNLHEPWGLKLATLISLIAVIVAWVAGTDRSLPMHFRSGPTRPTSDFFSLRPVRAWLVGKRAKQAPEYTAAVMYPFERAFGWRLRVRDMTWVCLLSGSAMLAVPMVILGREAHVPAVGLLTVMAIISGGITALGMAASLSGEREQGRWTFLLCSKLEVPEILWAKWRAVCMETWPLWLASGIEAALLAVGGALPWAAVPVAALGAAVAATSAAGVTAGLCARVPSLTAAQQRAVLLILVPPLTVLAASWLLPGLPGLGYLSLPHMLASGMLFRHGFATPGMVLAAFVAYGVLGLVGLALARWQLDRWPPVS